MNALNTIVANAIEKSKLGEAAFVKHLYVSISNQLNTYVNFSVINEEIR
jgi:hypothetical protein